MTQIPGPPTHTLTHIQTHTCDSAWRCSCSSPSSCAALSDASPRPHTWAGSSSSSAAAGHAACKVGRGGAGRAEGHASCMAHGAHVPMHPELGARPHAEQAACQHLHVAQAVHTLCTGCVCTTASGGWRSTYQAVRRTCMARTYQAVRRTCMARTNQAVRRTCMARKASASHPTGVKLGASASSTASPAGAGAVGPSTAAAAAATPPGAAPP